MTFLTMKFFSFEKDCTCEYCRPLRKSLMLRRRCRRQEQWPRDPKKLAATETMAQDGIDADPHPTTTTTKPNSHGDYDSHRGRGFHPHRLCLRQKSAVVSFYLRQSMMSMTRLLDGSCQTTITISMSLILWHSI